MFIFFSYSIKFFFFDMEICTIKEMNWELTCHWCGWWSASSLIQKKNQKLSEIVYTYVSLHLLLHVPRKYPAYKLTKKKTPRKTCFNLDFLLLFLLVCLFCLLNYLYLTNSNWRCTWSYQHTRNRIFIFHFDSVAYFTISYDIRTLT